MVVRGKGTSVSRPWLKLDYCHQYLESIDGVLILLYPIRLSYHASLRGRPLCCTCWSCGLSLQERSVLLWPLPGKVHLFVPAWLNCWGRSLESKAPAYMPCKWMRRWGCYACFTDFLLMYSNLIWYWNTYCRCGFFTKQHQKSWQNWDGSCWKWKNIEIGVHPLWSYNLW